MLQVDHTLRITARQAIQHSFFNSVREKVYEDYEKDCHQHGRVPLQRYGSGIEYL